MMSDFYHELGRYIYVWVHQNPNAASINFLNNLIYLNFALLSINVLKCLDNKNNDLVHLLVTTGN